MNPLREYIQATLNETRFKQMSKSKFTDLQHYLANSSFLDADPEGDLDDDDDWASEAASVLRDDLNDYFDDKFGNGLLTAIVKVDMMATDSDTGMDNALKGANYYFESGLHFIEVMLASIEDGPTFRDVGNVSQKAYEVLLHELLHMQQFMKFSKGDPTDEKWDQFIKEYKKRGGASGMKQDYFFFDQIDGASELETFSLQIAIELINALGKEATVSLLQKQYPDYETIRKNSSSFRNIEAKGNNISRPEFRELIKRAKQYAKG